MSMLVHVVIRLWTLNRHTGLGVTPLIDYPYSSSPGSTEARACPRFARSSCQSAFGAPLVRSPIAVQVVSQEKGSS